MTGPVAAGLLLWVAMSAGAEPVLGSMSISATVSELAAAAGVQRVDASTLPLDIVRIAFASPEGQDEARTRAAMARLLQRDGAPLARLPLPLPARTWTARVFEGRVTEGRLAASIFASRSAALLYYGLMGVDPGTLAWIDANPAALDTLSRSAGVTAGYARSLRVRDDRVVTPGDSADEVWTAIVGASPDSPAAFIAKLWTARSGRVAGFYDAIAHLDPPHRAFAIGKAGDPDRVARARSLLDAITAIDSQWRLADHPFRRPDVDAAVLLRTIRVTPAGALAPPASREIWSRVFGGVSERGVIDAAWLARRIMEGGGSVARQRLDTLLFAQRTLGSAPPADEEAVIETLTAFGRYPVLMLTLEGHGLDATAFAAAARAAAALTHRDAIAIFQSGLAIVDRARRAGTLETAQSRAAIASLVEAARSAAAADALIGWVRDALLPLLRQAVAKAEERGADAIVLAAMAGPSSKQGLAIEWEGQRYRVDPANAEMRRLAALRENQEEPSIDKALAAASARDLGVLAHSMMAVVYADALGEPDGQPAAAGPVWRKHRFEGNPGADLTRPVAWRMADEVFAAEGWHLAGSLLRLDLALARLVLRRLDSTEMPAGSALPDNSRRELALSVALIDPRALTDEDRDAIAAALSRGRMRAAALTKDPSALEAAAADAGVSEWRANGMRWLIDTGEPSAARGAFTLLEIYRLGGGTPRAAWGTAAIPMDGCFCLQFPERLAPEDLGGRPATGQMATHFGDVMLRTADALAARHLPALLARDIAAFATEDAMDRARPAFLDDWLPVAYAARDLTESQFDDYVAALTVAGPLVPLARGGR